MLELRVGRSRGPVHEQVVPAVRQAVSGFRPPPGFNPDGTVQDERMDNAALLAKVRELHRPVWDTFTTLMGTPGALAYCKGCDLGVYAASDASWPCSTAEIVYTADEIEKLKEGP